MAKFAADYPTPTLKLHQIFSKGSKSKWSYAQCKVRLSRMVQTKGHHGVSNVGMVEAVVATSLIWKTSQAFEHSNPLKSSPGSHSQLVSDSVGITRNFLLLVFLILVSLASSHLCCICFLVSRTYICARLLIVATPVLKAAVKPAKVNSHCNNIVT